MFLRAVSCYKNVMKNIRLWNTPKHIMAMIGKHIQVKYNHFISIGGVYEEVWSRFYGVRVDQRLNITS